MARKKSTRMVGPALTTREDVAGTIRNIAYFTLLREDQENAMNEQIHNTRKIYEPKIVNADTEIARLKSMLKTWAENNKKEFGQKKSLDFFHGSLVFRTGTPKLKTLSKWTLAKVKEAIIKKKLGGTYTRTKVTVDKDQLLADRKSLGKAALAEIGVKVVQEEGFDVCIKREKVEPARMAAQGV